MTTMTRTLARRALTVIGAASLTLAAGGAGFTHAQEDDPVEVFSLRGYPLAIHQGTCDTLVAEPSYELGALWPRPLLVTDDADDDVYTAGDFYDDGDDEPLAEDTGFLIDDVDDDGVDDYGLDLDQDNVLSSDEVLQQPIVWASENELAEIEGAIADDEGAELGDLRDVPHALVVHQNAITDTDYLACAEIAGPVGDEGDLIVVLRPMGSDGFTGMAEFEQTADGFLGIGGDGGASDVYVWPSRATAPPAS